MKDKILNRKDFFAGLTFIFFGLLSVTISLNYPIGTAARMGPGFFPFILGSGLALIGFIVMLRSFWLPPESMPRFALRPLGLVIGSVAAFALLIGPIGMILAVMVLIFTSSVGSHEFNFREVVFLSLILASIAVGVFVYGLGLPFKVWPL